MVPGIARPTRRMVATAISCLLVVGMLVMTPTRAGRAASAVPALPDLQSLIPASDLSITHPTAMTKALNYTHIVYNAGEGPLEIRPEYDPATGLAQAFQRLYTYDASGNLSLVSSTRLVGTFFWHAAHNHYHFPLASFGLYSLAPDGSVGTPVVASQKNGFCLADSQIVNTLAHTPSTQNYEGAGCADPTTTRGIDVGWGDQYDWTDPGQSIDITGVPDGTYWFRSIVDPFNYIIEKSKANNITDLKIRISGDTVAVLSTANPAFSLPSVSLTAPSAGSLVSGSVTLAGNAGDQVGIASVQFVLDGAPLGAPASTAPYLLSWNTAGVPNGAHVLSVQATDTAGIINTAPAVLVHVYNPPVALGTIRIDRQVFQDEMGPVTTPSFDTSGTGELLLALVACDGPSTQTVTLSGAGLTWTLARRSKGPGQSGTVEVWKAVAPGPLAGATVTSTPTTGGFDQSLTVLALTGADIGAVAGGADFSGLPSVALTTTRAGSIVVGIGFDWSNPAPHPPATGQFLLHQWLDGLPGDGFWAQASSSPIPTAGTTVSVSSTAPTGDQWLLGVVEIVPTTLPPPPVISSAGTSSVTSAGATVTWTTTTPADSQVEYGTSSAYGSTTSVDAALVTAHSVPVAGLSPNTLYHYRVDSRDAYGQLSRSADSTFTTGLPAPPVVMAVQAVSITSSGATVTWATDQASSSQVEYGPTSSYGSSTPLDPALLTNHAVVLMGLSPGTLYHYRVKSANGSTQLTSSGDYTFTTNVPPPVITVAQANGVTATSATITWTTDVVSTSQVLYGTTAAYGSSTTLDSTPVTSHSQALTGLAPATTYHYQVQSSASGSLGTSADLTFTTATPPAPTISAVLAGSITGSGAIVTWTTDSPADSQVEYGSTTAYGSSTSTSLALVTSHTRALSGLAPLALYHYRVKSKDSYGQLSVSGDFTFTTTASAAPVFRSRSQVINDTTVARPSGVVAGDLLLASLEVDQDTVTVSGPAGWTLLLDTAAAQGTSSAFHAQVWYRVATAGEPSAYQWNVPAGVYVDIAVLDYSGVNAGSPIDASIGVSALSTATPTTASVTTSAANDMLVAFFVNYNFATWTPGSGMTSRYDFDGCTGQDTVQLAAGSTGTKTATASAFGPITAQMVALRAA